MDSWSGIGIVRRTVNLIGDAIEQLAEGELRPLPKDVKKTLEELLWEIKRRAEPVVLPNGQMVGLKQSQQLFEQTIKQYFNDGYAVREYLKEYQRLPQ